MDEVTIGLIYPLIKCWMKKGQQKRLPMTTGKRLYQHLAGVLNWHTEQVHCYPLHKLNSESIIAFFEWLFTEVYPTQPIVLVLDNAPWHHSQAVQAALSCFEERVLALWLPPYSPDLNPIERYWKHLKANACANFLFSSLNQLIEYVFQFLSFQNQVEHSFHLSFSKNF